VTAFAAIFDASTGELAFANAGHEPPFAARAGREAERIAPSGGPPLGALDASPIRRARRFAPGEWLCSSPTARTRR
jgi:sigma-B regulation protein RsbU (phosphoserine phosphatase)